MVTLNVNFGISLSTSRTFPCEFSLTLYTLLSNLTEASNHEQNNEIYREKLQRMLNIQVETLYMISAFIIITV